MCQSIPVDASFWFNLFQLDRYIAEQVRKLGCPHCGSKLHVANYPRKPRGVRRDVLGPEYTQRFSFCCSVCDKRTTPPSVRFLGRKVYLGSIITLLSAGAHGLSGDQRARLLDELDVPAQTLHRWRCWWTQHVPASATWRSLSGWFSPPIPPCALPGELLTRLQGPTLARRLQHLLRLICPLTSSSCPHSQRVLEKPTRCDRTGLNDEAWSVFIDQHRSRQDMTQAKDPQRWARLRFAVVGPLLAAPPPPGQ